MELGFSKRVFSSVWMEAELISWGLEVFCDLAFLEIRVMRSLLFVNLPYGDENLPPGFPESWVEPHCRRGREGGGEQVSFLFSNLCLP